MKSSAEKGLIDLGAQIVQNVQAGYESNWFQAFQTFKTFQSFSISARSRRSNRLTTVIVSRDRVLRIYTNRDVLPQFVTPRIRIPHLNIEHGTLNTFYWPQNAWELFSRILWAWAMGLNGWK